MKTRILLLLLLLTGLTLAALPVAAQKLPASNHQSPVSNTETDCRFVLPE